MARRVSKDPGPLKEAAQARARGCVKLALRLAHKQFDRCGRTVPLEELAGEARLALVVAASVFDEGRGVPFDAYAKLVVRRRLVQVVTEWRRGGKLDHVRFTDLIGLDIPSDALPTDPPCHRTTEPGGEAAAREVVDRVRRSMPARWFAVLELYYAQGHTLGEIGKQLGLSRQRVRKIISQAAQRAKSHCPSECDAW